MMHTGYTFGADKMKTHCHLSGEKNESQGWAV